MYDFSLHSADEQHCWPLGAMACLQGAAGGGLTAGAGVALLQRDPAHPHHGLRGRGLGFFFQPMHKEHDSLFRRGRGANPLSNVLAQKGDPCCRAPGGK